MFLFGSFFFTPHFLLHAAQPAGLGAIACWQSLMLRLRRPAGGSECHLSWERCHVLRLRRPAGGSVAYSSLFAPNRLCFAFAVQPAEAFSASRKSLGRAFFAGAKKPREKRACWRKAFCNGKSLGKKRPSAGLCPDALHLSVLGFWPRILCYQRFARKVTPLCT